LAVTGHVAVGGLPTVTPFENGRPRRHAREFPRPDLDSTALVVELFVPPTGRGSVDEVSGSLAEREPSPDDRMYMRFRNRVLLGIR
jgi:uncharacterized protein